MWSQLQPEDPPSNPILFNGASGISSLSLSPRAVISDDPCPVSRGAAEIVCGRPVQRASAFITWQSPGRWGQRFRREL